MCVNLAIETSSRQGSVSLGRGDELLGSAQVPKPTRHAIELTPTIDQLCTRHGIEAKQLDEVYVSIGPGSFTGLRIAVATAKMLAKVVGAKIVAVPTIDVVVENAPIEFSHVAVWLNTKRDQGYACVYERVDSSWRPVATPALLTAAQLCKAATKSLAVLGDHLPAYDWPAQVTLLEPTLAVPVSETLWRLGRAMAKQGEFTDPYKLLPLYARLPEAVELWEAKNRKAAEQQSKRC